MKNVFHRLFDRITPAHVNGLVLVALLFALYNNWLWPWGVLFIYWAVPALKNGEVHLVAPIFREDNPLLFWAVTFLWVALGVLTIMEDLAPQMLIDFYYLISSS